MFRERYEAPQPPKGGIEDNLVISQDTKIKSKKNIQSSKKEFGGCNPGTPPLGGWGAITKENIFHYVYAVLHNPAYKAKYEQNLKRDFPRIPFYDDFWKWAKAGKELMELHLNYEQVQPFELERIEKPETEFTHFRGTGGYKAKLKANKLTGEIIIDEKTTLTGIPKTAWEYKLGNRSALEWILDQYKESKSRDGTIEEKFNTYKFTDYKEKVIELLNKVCTVSVESMKITDNL